MCCPDLLLYGFLYQAQQLSINFSYYFLLPNNATIDLRKWCLCFPRALLHIPVHACLSICYLHISHIYAFFTKFPISPWNGTHSSTLLSAQGATCPYLHNTLGFLSSLISGHDLSPPSLLKIIKSPCCSELSPQASSLCPEIYNIKLIKIKMSSKADHR